MSSTLSRTILALIEQVSNGENGEAFQQAALKYDALPLAEGWFAWALLTKEGQVMEATEDGPVKPAVDPLRTMFLVAGVEKFPELEVLLPVRSDSCVECAQCQGSGWMQYGNKQIRCHICRSLGWVEAPSGV
ncbi:MAG TPA: hypothetical protein VFV88_04055 [Steroidobacteraceae bacterium]|nr:hypothetical protein [Steroidobacteraceae bacterium]